MNEEDVGAADVLLNLDEDFIVGEAADDRFGQRGAEVVANGLGERGIGIAGDELDRSVIARHCLSPARPAETFADLIQAAWKAGNMNRGLVPAGFWFS